MQSTQTAGVRSVHERPRVASPLRRLLTLEGLSTATAAGRFGFLAMVLAVVVVSPIVIVNALSWIDRPFAGFLVNPRMRVGTVGQYHWTGPAAGVRNPDIVLEANGRHVKSFRDLDEVVTQTPIGAPVRYLIDRRGGPIAVTVPTMRFTATDLGMTFWVTFLSGLALFGVGAIVFVLKPDTSASFAFLFACFLLSLYSIISFDVFSSHWGFIRLYLLADTFIPAAFLHLSLVFPERSRFVQRHPWLHVAPYVVSAALTVPYQVFYKMGPDLIVARATRFYAVVAAVSLTIAALTRCFGRASALAKQRSKVVLFGAALAFPLPAAARYSSLVGGSFLGVTIQTNLLAIPIILFPASIAYAIARHNLFDVDVYIKRAVGWGVMTALVASSYVSLQAVVERLVLDPMFGAAGQRLYPILFALLVVFLYNPVTEWVQNLVDRVFFRTRLDYKTTISAVSGALTSLLNVGEILRQVVYTVRTEMFIDRAGVIVRERDGRPWTVFLIADTPGTVTPEPTTASVGDSDPIVALLREEKTLITKYDLEEDPRYADVAAGCLSRFTELGATLAIPLLYHDDVAGALILGHKKSGQFYTRDDVDLLATMANQAAVAIQNATTHEEVVRYAEELAASLRRIQLLESIKSNLAKFVPKTVQDLIEQSPEAPLLDKREADVSVLFADISGYTRLSAQMGLDEVNRLVERYFGAFLDEILANGGDVNETAGDGLMVIFRDADPRRHARAAVGTAVAIQRRTAEINEELRGQSEPIIMHLGVNSGIASVGATRIEGVAGTRWTYTASGSTTNLAARLAAVSEGGAVVISDETRRRVGEEIDVESMGPQLLKNIAHPVDAYRVIAERRKERDPVVAE